MNSFKEKDINCFVNYQKSKFKFIPKLIDSSSFDYKSSTFESSSSNLESTKKAQNVFKTESKFKDIPYFLETKLYSSEYHPTHSSFISSSTSSSSTSFSSFRSCPSSSSSCTSKTSINSTANYNQRKKNFLSKSTSFLTFKSYDTSASVLVKSRLSISWPLINYKLDYQIAYEFDKKTKFKSVDQKKDFSKFIFSATPQAFKNRFNSSLKFDDNCFSLPSSTSVSRSTIFFSSFDKQKSDYSLNEVKCGHLNGEKVTKLNFFLNQNKVKTNFKSSSIHVDKKSTLQSNQNLIKINNFNDNLSFFSNLDEKKELIKIRSLLQSLDPNKYKSRSKLITTKLKFESSIKSKISKYLSIDSSSSKLLSSKSSCFKPLSFNQVDLNQVQSFTSIKTRSTPFDAHQKFKRCIPFSSFNLKNKDFESFSYELKLYSMKNSSSQSNQKNFNQSEQPDDNLLVSFFSNKNSDTMLNFKDKLKSSKKNDKIISKIKQEADKFTKSAQFLVVKKSKSLILNSFDSKKKFKKSSPKRYQSCPNICDLTLVNFQSHIPSFLSSVTGLSQDKKSIYEFDHYSPSLTPEPSLSELINANASIVKHNSLTNLAGTLDESNIFNHFSTQNTLSKNKINDLLLILKSKNNDKMSQSILNQTSAKEQAIELDSFETKNDSLSNLCSHLEPNYDQFFESNFSSHQRKASLPVKTNFQIQKYKRHKRATSSLLPLSHEKNKENRLNEESKLYNMFENFDSRYSEMLEKSARYSNDFLNFKHLTNSKDTCSYYDLIQEANSSQKKLRYHKKRLRGPYGEMLEQEMKKSSLNEKPNFKYLQDLIKFDKLPVKEDKSRLSHCFTNLSECSSLSSIKSESLVEIDSFKNVDQHSSTSSFRSSSFDSSLTHNQIKLCSSNQDKSESLNDWSNEKKNGRFFRRISLIKKKEDTRTHIVGELYDTEKSYVESLQVLVNKYMKPLKMGEYSNLIESNVVDEVFYQIPEILGHHELFLERLKDRLNNWDSKQNVGDVFVNSFTQKPIIGTYTAFINNWKKANEAIKLAVQAKPGFAKYLDNMSREHKGKLTLDAILIMPVQRIPRYELLIKELLKHTNINHPDYQLLLTAQKEVHELALKINRIEREAFQHKQMIQKVKEIENFIEGVMDLSSNDRAFLRYDFVSIPGSLGNKKERCLFLFSDLLVITSIKKKSSSNRKFSTVYNNPSPCNSLEGNKFKYLMKFPLENIDISKDNDSHLRKAMKEIENLKEDMATLNQVIHLISNLKCSHQQLDEVVKDLNNSVSKHFNEKQTSDSQLFSLDLTITSSESIENLTIIFSNTEKRLSWETTFINAKEQLALSSDQIPKADFFLSLPIRKTRAGLQISCACSTLDVNQFGFKEVWICNSDGYVGQVCILSFQPAPIIASCNDVCNSRILCVEAVPALSHKSYSQVNSKPNHVPKKILINDHSISEPNKINNTELLSNSIAPNLSSDLSNQNSSLFISPQSEIFNTLSSNAESLISSFHDLKDNFFVKKFPNQFQLDSDSSENENESITEKNEILNIPCETFQSLNDSFDSENNQPTMWLGAEDECIYVYNCNEHPKNRKSKLKIKLSSTVNSIIYLNNNVYIALANGQLALFQRDSTGCWLIKNAKFFTIAALPILKLVAVAGKIWCSVQNQVKIFSTFTMSIETSFQVCSDPNRVILCMVNSGFNVWISTKKSPIIKLYHGSSYECLFKIDISPAVEKMLETCDEIIRQHKVACLKVTALLVCKDLLWIGTSAGAILTLPLPHNSCSFVNLDYCPIISGIPHGHTGHVRILTAVEVNSSQTLNDSSFFNTNYNESIHSNLKVLKKFDKSGKADSTQSSKMFIISGGDGHEIFTNLGQNESIGRDDSTSHLLLWQIQNLDYNKKVPS